MEYMEQYEEWLNNPYFDEDTKNELITIKDNEKEIKDKIYTNLEFGTAGLRDIIAAGRIELILYCSKSCIRLANYIIKNIRKEGINRGVVIAHDNRHISREFCIKTANTLAACGIKAYIFDSLRTTQNFLLLLAIYIL